MRGETTACVLFIAGFKLWFALAGYCTQSYQCQSTCTRASRYSESCGIFNWNWVRCTKYKTVSYSCTKTCYKRACCSGYTGSQCSSALCFGRTYCLNGGTCEAPDQCHCGEGLILSSDRHTCLDVNECGTNNGGCEHKCVNENGSYRCECNDGYKLNTDLKTCSDIDECSAGISKCAHECSNTQGSYICNCHQGYELSLDEKFCEDVDECSSGTSGCSHLCDNADGSFFCSCSRGFELQPDKKTCEDVDECTNTENDCEHVCVAVPGSYRCVCNKGFRLNTDKRTCTDIDECDENTSGCEQTCENIVGSYVCGCNEGYMLDIDRKTCLDIDDCLEANCLNGGSCVDGVGTVYCVCKAGFTGDVCQTDIDECSIMNGGCQDVCSNTHGSYECSCGNGKTLNINGKLCIDQSKSDTVFTKHSIPRQLLPRGCDMTLLTSCGNETEHKVYLSSTSDWYMLDADNNVLFTHGIVFAEVNSLSIPIAVNGVRVKKGSKDFSVNMNDNHYKSTEGKPIYNRRTGNCLSSNFTSEDIFDFISHDSFLKTFVASIGVILPDWLKLGVTNTSILDIKDLKAEIAYGDTINSFPWCKGASVLPDHLYSVFNFDSSFSLSVYGNRIELPKLLNNQKFCLVVDMCHNYGGSVFLMVPKESEQILMQLTIFKTLYETHNLLIKPRGIGISAVKGIHVHTSINEMQLWNGDHIFRFPGFDRADLWVGGDIIKTSDVFIAECSADLYVSVPSPERILSAMFIDEWNIIMRTKASFSPILRFRLSGKQYSITFDDFIAANADVYISIGGTGMRQWCGDSSNPPGIFVSALVEINPFQNIPILQDWVIENTHTLYAFVTVDLSSSLNDKVNVDVLTDLLELDGILSRLKAWMRNEVTNFQHLLSNDSEAALAILEDAVNNFQYSVAAYIESHSQGDVSLAAGAFTEFWKQATQLEASMTEFMDTELYFHQTQDGFTTRIQYELANIKEIIDSAIRKLSDQVGNALESISGFGFKYTTTLSVFGLKLPSIDIELVSSESNLMMCSRFNRVKDLLKGQTAVRFLGRASIKKRLGRFLKLDRGVGLGGALATDSTLLIVQFNAYINIIGIRATADLFISQSGLHLYMEGNVWGIFLAQVDISAEVNKDWYHLTFNLQGKFVAKSRRRRQLQTEGSSFQSSYLDGLKKVIRTISDEAEKRLTQVQNALTMAESGLSKAQNWLDKQKDKVRAADVAFDKAVATLEKAKDALETAKGPFLRAIATLENAQRRVDNLCKIRNCRKICIPGIKCKWCRGWIPYPCCRLTHCMISFPDPLCVLANLLCYAVRAIAFLALEVAKLFVRIPLLTFDAAKIAVSVAQVVVDKSRVVLNLAEGVLEVANIALEAAKGVLNLAKVALEILKITIKTAAKILEFVIEYGLKNIVDVRNCGFNIEVSTIDLPVFDVFCEVNAFNLGWRIFRLPINFRNIHQTIWQVAKATIKAITKGLADIFGGRKRRDIAFDASSRMHLLLRHARQSVDDSYNATLEFMNETINVINYTVGFNSSVLSDYENRVLLFEQKCDTMTTIHAFLYEVWETLFELTNETNTVLDEVAAFSDPLLVYNITKLTQNMTLENANVSSKHAFSDYNLTQSDLDRALEDTKASAAADPSLQEVPSVANLSKELIKSELESFEQSSVLNSWILGMENRSKAYFNESECVDLRDCILYSASELFDLYMEENHPNLTEIKQTLSDLEDDFISIITNTSLTVANIYNASVSISFKLKFLADSNVFCSKPPQFLSQLKNVTIGRGLTVLMKCNVTADPPPRFWWFKNNELIENAASKVLVILSATEADEATYQCMAGNIVANISSNEAFLNLDETVTNIKDTDHTDPEESFALICYSAPLVLLITNVVFVALHIYRIGKKKSFALTVILPASVMCSLAIATQILLHSDYTAEINCGITDGFVVPIVVMALTEGIAVGIVGTGRRIAGKREDPRVVPTLSLENTNITDEPKNKSVYDAFTFACTDKQEAKMEIGAAPLYKSQPEPQLASDD